MTTESISILKMNKKGKKVIPLHGLHIVFPEEREMGKMQFGSQFNSFQSTIIYIYCKWWCENCIDYGQEITCPLNIGEFSL